MIDNKSIFIAFDTETTGLSASEGRVVEIAAVKFDLNGNVIDKFVELVNPGVPIPGEVIRIHHIDDAMVADKPGMDIILPRFIDFFSGDNNILIAQNAVFDIGFVNQEALRHDIKLPRHIVLDQIDLTRHVFPNLSTYSLEPTCRAMKLVDSQLHRAMSDAMLVMKLFLHCLKQIPDEAERFNILNTLCHYTFGGPMIVQIAQELLDVVSLALETGGTLEIYYSGGSMKGKPRPIAPTLMYNRDGVMYLTATCLLSHARKQFRLDRITQCRIVDTTSDGL